MNRQSYLFAFLVLATACFAQITPVGGTTAGPTTSPVGTPTPIVFTYSPTAGNTVVMFLPVTAGATYPYCQDNLTPPNTVFPGAQVTVGTNTLTAFSAVAASGVTGYVCQGIWTGNMVGLLDEFSGVSGVNLFLAGNSATNTGTAASFSVTTEDPNDAVVCGIMAKLGTTTFSSLSGTLLQSVSSSTPRSVLFWIAQPVAGTVTCSGTLSAGPSQGWLGAAVELKTTNPTSTWNLVQITPSNYSTPTGFTPIAGCQRGINNCSFVHPSTGSSHVLVDLMNDDQDSQVGSGTQVTMTSIYSCNVSPSSCTPTASACTSANAIGSWTILNTGGTNGNGCEGYGHAGTGLYQESTAGAINLSSTSGANCTTVTRLSNNGNEPWSQTLFETIPSSTPSLDDVESAGNNSYSLTNTMTGTTATGSPDIIFQAYSGPEQSSVTSPYTVVTSYTHTNMAYAITNSGSAPTWTSTGENISAAGCGLAVKVTPLLAPSFITGGKTIHGGKGVQ